MGVFLGTRPHSKRVAVAVNRPPGMHHQPLALPHHGYSPRDEYDIAGGMLSDTYNVTSPKRHKPSAPSSPTAQVYAGLSGNTCYPDSPHSPLSEQQLSMIKATSECLLDMVILDTGPLRRRVEDSRSLAERITRMYTLMTMARAVSTRKQDTGSNWRYWLQWCKFQLETVEVRHMSSVVCPRYRSTYADD